MTNEDRIRALEKIAQSSEEAKAFLEGQAKAHGDYAKSRNETSDSLSGWGNTVGAVGGGVGGAMTWKGLKQMLDKGPKIVPGGKNNPQGPIKATQSNFEMVHYDPVKGWNGKPPTGFYRGNGSAVPILEKGFVMRDLPKGEIIPHPGVSRNLSKIKGRGLALKGGLLGLGSLGVSALLRAMASSNKNKANEHTKSLEQINDQLR